MPDERMTTQEDNTRKRQQLQFQLQMLHNDLPKSFGSSRRCVEPKKSKTDVLDAFVRDIFNKQFSIDNTSCTMPKLETMFTEEPWSIPELQKLKTDLNETKNCLNDYNIVQWHKHTQRRNKAGDVQWKLRKEVDPEFLTQAWCKFYENASSFPLISTAAVEAQKLVSVHLCEAPGAFITSLNHWLKLNRPCIEWDWIATTLNPYYEGNPLSCMINDDRFIISSLDHWSFGVDYTGNLMNLNNMNDLLEKCKKKGDILLVTADGSIDCMDKPGEQESVVAPLHYCEAITALHLLSQHGSLLLKMFTLFEHTSICLVYLLSCSFERIVVNKPVTSKEGNSEVYLVCLDFKGPAVVLPYLENLRRYYEVPSGKSMFRKEDIPVEFIQQLINCGQFFVDHQSIVITENILAYQHDEDQTCVEFEVKRIRHMVANKFMKMHGVRKLESENMEVIGKTKLAHTRSIHLEPRVPDGSYNTRRNMENLDSENRLLALCCDSNSIDAQPTIQWFSFAESFPGLHISCGKPFSKVQSSKFCVGKLLKLRNEIADLLNQTNINIPSNDLHLVKDYINNTECSTNEYKYIEFDNNVIARNNFTIRMIYEKLQTVSKGQNLILVGFPLLTQLNVGILYLLAHAFESLGLILNNELGCLIILKTFLFTENIRECFRQVNTTASEAEAVDASVISILPITKLCETELYAHLIHANHWSIKHYVNSVRDYMISQNRGMTMLPHNNE